MNILDLTEPFFQHVCRLNRVARKSATVDYAVARNEVRDLFVVMAEKSRANERLARQYQKIEPALIYFVDSIISESRLPFAAEWNNNRLAYERQELAGDERFFDLLDETLTDKNDESAERLAVFYTCIGLGFTGWFAGQPDLLRRKMAEIAPRIRRLVESDDSVRICPETYESTNTSNLPMPVGTRLIGIAIIFCGLILVVLFANVWLFRASSEDLNRSLAEISKHEPALKRQP